jgi:hypothetical protein
MIMKIARGAAVLGAVVLAVAAVQTDGMTVPILTVGVFLIAGLGAAVYGLLETATTPDLT